MELENGSVDRSYLLHEKLGEGGMGTVYRATQLVTGQIVALKLVPEQRQSDETGDSTGTHLQFRLALAREFQTLASLHHPNVIRVLSYGFDERLGPYFVMDLLKEARPLVDGTTSYSEETQVKLIAQLLRALAYIHRRGVIHRDIKPGNVLVVGDEVKLLDFGISVEKSDTPETAGSIDYMAPELLRDERPSEASDLYAVGMLLYQLIVGRLPSAALDMDAMLDGLLGEDTTKPQRDTEPQDDRSQHTAPIIDHLGTAVTLSAVTKDIPGPLGQVVSKLLAPDLALRYRDANTALRELAAAVPYELPVETAATRESFLRATTLIGRDAELEQLTEALAQAKRGVGAAFLIGGESGVGKSRLLAELRTHGLVHDSWVAEGQSLTAGGSYYQEWLPLLRALCFRADLTDEEAAVFKDLVPDIGALLERQIPDAPVVKPEEAQARMVATLVGLLGRQPRPLVLILEDLQWGRTESLALLTQLVKHIHGLPVLLVGAFRVDEAPQLPQLLPEMQLIQLKPLDPQNIARLSQSMLGEVGRQPELVAYLERQTEGNAFFLVEVVRALAENAGELQRIGQGELPETVLTIGIERIVERRVEQVDDAFRPLLDFAATLGRKLDLPVMERVFPNTALRPFLLGCANAAILESQGTDWRFAHNKLREAILHRLAPERRRHLHGQAAEALEAIHVESTRDALSATLAYHFEEAGVPDKALQYYIQAGDSATKLYLFAEARTHYAAAKTALERLPDSPEVRRLHVDILLKQVHTGLTTQLQLTRLVEARSLLEGLMNSAAARPDDRLRMARIDYYCGQAYHFDGQPREAIRYYQRVLPIAQEFPDQQLRIMPSYVIGGALCIQGQFGKARELLAQATEPMLRYFGDSLDVRRCMMYRCIALAGSGHCRHAMLGIERVRNLTRPSEPPIHHIVFHLYHAVTATVMTDWPVVDKVTTELAALLEGTSEQLFLYLTLDFLAWAKSHLGHNADALKIRARARQIRQSTISGGLGDWFEAAYGEILMNGGETEQAMQHAQKVVASSQKAGLPYSQAIAERTWGCALARLGADPAEAAAHFTASRQIAEAADQVINVALAEQCWGEMCRDRGDSAAAQPHFAEALRLLEWGGYEFALTGARRISAKS